MTNPLPSPIRVELPREPDYPAVVEMLNDHGGMEETWESTQDGFWQLRAVLSVTDCHVGALVRWPDVVYRTMRGGFTLQACQRDAPRIDDSHRMTVEVSTVDDQIFMTCRCGVAIDCGFGPRPSDLAAKEQEHQAKQS